MQLEVKIDESVKEPKIIVLTDKITPEISDLVQRLTEAQRNIIAGFRENNVTLLDEKELLGKRQSVRGHALGRISSASAAV